MQLNTLFYLALILFAGLIFGRAVKQAKLPNVTGYLMAGLLIGPFVLKLVPADTVKGLELVSNMALAFIAFSIGSEFKLTYLRKVGMMPIVIAIFEGLTASFAVTLILVLFGFDTELALLLGAIASATAPAATIMVVKQYKAKGPVTETLLSVVALDDAVALIAFGFAVAIVNTMQNPGETSFILAILKPVAEILGALILGFVLGLIFKFPLRYFKKDSNRLIITCGFVFLGSSIASMLGLSPLLLCMAMSTTLMNVSSEGDSILKLADTVTPPIFLMFFVVSGMELDITVLPQVGIIGILYIIFRVIGKIGGTAIGAALMKAPAVIRKYLGFSLVPQAGVAIGLTLLASQLVPEYAQTIRAVVLSATLIYELTGPAITKASLSKAGELNA